MWTTISVNPLKSYLFHVDNIELSMKAESFVASFEGYLKDINIFWTADVPTKDKLCLIDEQLSYCDVNYSSPTVMLTISVNPLKSYLFHVDNIELSMRAESFVATLWRLVKEHLLKRRIWGQKMNCSLKKKLSSLFLWCEQLYLSIPWRAIYFMLTILYWAR